MTHAFPHVPENLNHSSHKLPDDAVAGGATDGPTEHQGTELNGASVADGVLKGTDQNGAVQGESDAPAAADANGVTVSDSQGHGGDDAGSDSGDRLGESEPVGSAVDKPAKSKARKGEPENVWVEFRNTLLLSAVIALGIRHFVFEARYIPTGSMLPTLEINDRLIIEKMSYRFREPTRGDVVVFAAPDSIKEKDPTFNDALIKRIVGLPGETIEVKEGKVFVDGEAIVENYINEVPNYVWGPQSVPEDSYLVLGDNRNNSYDSHFWGFLPDDNLIGRAAVRVWPPGRFGAIDEQPAYYFEAESEGGLAEPAE